MLQQTLGGMLYSPTLFYIAIIMVAGVAGVIARTFRKIKSKVIPARLLETHTRRIVVKRPSNLSVDGILRPGLRIVDPLSCRPAIISMPERPHYFSAKTFSRIFSS